MNPQGPSPVDRSSLVSDLNRAAFLDLMRKHRQTLRASDLDCWRPTARVSGEVPGVWACVTVVATDGILGWFETAASTLLVGHIQHFTGAVKPLFSASTHKVKPQTEQQRVRVPGKPRSVSPTMSKSALRAKMLEDL